MGLRISVYQYESEDSNFWNQQPGKLLPLSLFILMAGFEMKSPWSHVPGWVEKSRLTVRCLPLGKGRLAGQGVGEAAPSGQRKRSTPSMNLWARRLYHIRGSTYRHFWRSLWFHSSAHAGIEPLRPGLAQHFPPQVPALPRVSPLLTENKVQRQAGAQQGFTRAFWPFLPIGHWLNSKGGLQSRLKGKPRLSSPAIGTW